MRTMAARSRSLHSGLRDTGALVPESGRIDGYRSVGAEHPIEVEQDLDAALHLRQAEQKIVGALAAEIRRLFDFSSRDVDRKSTRLNSSHQAISYAVFC